ncbi:MAG TPA: methylmalonyl Co-A mutase-associated GTPase MeaB [Euryarchaeota archaeon]|nr:methylmalonyl Co-A mutase-associated GTPase MeaB [Euryarchaeota archaeon]
MKGDPRAIARMITLAENASPEARECMKVLHSRSGNAHVIGITGVMGAGKSTLISELAREYRKRGKRVGIIAIDPTSPFSGGALLGDRIRMMELATDPDIFIRSMGTRGMLGGLTGAVYDVVEILDASGKDIVIVETVGVGQAEVDVIKIADTTLVVLVPGLGDSIQSIKAGIMEIADVYAVNKADRPGFERTMAEIESLVELIADRGEERTPIIPVIAKEGKGIPELADTIDAHRKKMEGTKEFTLHRRRRYEAELVEIIRKRLMKMIFDEDVFRDRVEDLIDMIMRKKKDPYSAADEILSQVLK